MTGPKNMGCLPAGNRQTGLWVIVRHMTEDENNAQDSAPGSKEHHLQSNVSGAYRPNMLLFSGIGLLIVATGMVLSNILS